ncbi:hypothetical protein GGR50DRAFT_491508 [Xylaria sp. CBS 124048]|nr:hypothetical protein GGR50DRAFT_491508 [Xylaria sp. CBS 124048]
MASPIPQCRGFAHPFLLLVRSTLRAGSTLESAPPRIASSLKTIPSRRRLFSLGRVLSNEKPRSSPTTSTANPTTRPPPLSSLDVSQMSIARRLAMKSQPTTLYEGAPQTGFLLSSYGATFFCMTSAAINSWFNIFNLPPGISSWVPVGFGVVSFMFAGLGTIFALRPSLIIRSIKVLPLAASKKSKQQAAPGGSAQRVLLEVAVRRISPVPLPLKRIQVEPQNVVMVNRFQNRPVAPSREAMAARTVEDAERRKAQRQYELDHIMTAPFRDAGRASSTIFDNLRRGLTGEGFAPVYINGIRYKLDIHGGYALENGQALDRIVKIQHDSRLARLQSETPTK